MNCDTIECTDSTQAISGILILRKCDESIKFVY